MKKLLPLILLLIGSGAGVGAGIFLRPAPVEEETQAAAGEHSSAEKQEQKPTDPEQPEGVEYVKMNNQFVVPVLKKEKINALVIISLSIEITAGLSKEVYDREPKLRDAFLGVLFDHANIGGFDGAFTRADNLNLLRQGLREAAQKSLGEEIIRDVLIVEIARQDY